MVQIHFASCYWFSTFRLNICTLNLSIYKKPQALNTETIPCSVGLVATLCHTNFPFDEKLWILLSVTFFIVYVFGSESHWNFYIFASIVRFTIKLYVCSWTCTSLHKIGIEIRVWDSFNTTRTTSFLLLKICIRFENWVIAMWKESAGCFDRFIQDIEETKWRNWALQLNAGDLPAHW